jgi:hypothetical protein
VAADGGPAFPKLDYFTRPDGGGGAPVSEGGMSLRDYFAGQYIAGRIARDMVLLDHVEQTADAAYRMADAMLKAREATHD